MPESIKELNNGKYIDDQMGNGVPEGGTTGQVLTKASNNDYDTEWSDGNGYTTDNFTILGKGTILDPILATGAVHTEDVDLSLDSYTITQPGLYKVYDSSQQYTNSIIFDVANPLDGQRITIINYQTTYGKILISGTSCSILYQGTKETISTIQTGMVYEFIYKQADSTNLSNTWYSYNPQPYFNKSLEFEGYDITVAGIYNFYNNIDNSPIVLPTPNLFDGLQIVICNSDTTYDIPYAGDNLPLNENQQSVTIIPTNTVHTMWSVGGNWQITNVYGGGGGGGGTTGFEQTFLLMGA